jgi:hypothetical protein
MSSQEPNLETPTSMADAPDTSIWISKDFDFKPYRKIMLDKVEVFVSPTSEYHGVSPDVLKGMADRFTASFKKALQSGYQLVDKPGPDVLRIRPALSGINLVKPSFNMTNVIPVIFVARAVSGSNQTMNVALTALLSFNLGVELGQLLVLVVLVPLLQALFRHAVAERIGTIILSVLVAHTAWHWMLERGETLRKFPLPTLAAAALASAMRWLMAAMVLAALVWLVAGALRRRK